MELFIHFILNPFLLFLIIILYLPAAYRDREIEFNQPQRTMKYLYLLTFTALFGLTACDKEYSDAYSYDSSSTIYTRENSTRFRELLLVIKPYLLENGQKKYIVTDAVRNVRLSINSKPWGSFNSLDVNTSLYLNSALGEFRVSDSAVKYAVIAPFQSQKDTLTTAGEYAQLLNNIFMLEPGFYFCKLESFELKDLSGETHFYETSVIQAVEIRENTRSAFLGEFEILINQ